MRSLSTRTRALAAVLGLWLGAAAGAALARPLHLQLANGIEATIHPPEHILRTMTVAHGSERILALESGLRYRLVTDIEDPVIANKGDGRFHPMRVESVVEALAAIEYPGLDLQVEVFVLPFPRREVPESSARDGMVLLSPGVRPVSDYAVHFTVAHEIGHVFQYRWFPERDVEGWRRYAHLRGIADEDRFHAGREHRNRPREIFAEDFRYLFGGDKATYSGSIENAALLLPDAVAGLETFLLGLTGRTPPALAARIVPAPNPFNPTTEIHVEFADEPPAQARVEVVDAHGRLVRRLFSGMPRQRTLSLPWDGLDARGARASSGVYFAHLEYEGARLASKLILVK